MRFLTMVEEGISFDVRAVKPYGTNISLQDCSVCYFGFSDTIGKVIVGGSITCGISTIENIRTVFSNPINEGMNYLVYQTSNLVWEYKNDYGKFVISEDAYIWDAIFQFNDGATLDYLVFLAPYLLYNTLADNLSRVDLEAMD